MSGGYLDSLSLEAEGRFVKFAPTVDPSIAERAKPFYSKTAKAKRGVYHLYFALDSRGLVDYAGVSMDIRRRITQHRWLAPGRKYFVIELEGWSREEAYAAERFVIQELRPRGNIQINPGGPPEAAVAWR